MHTPDTEWEKEVVKEYQKSIDSINGSVVQAYKTLKKLKDGTFDPEYLPKMGILIDVDKMHEMELVRDLFGDENVAKLLYQDGKDYDIEVLVRRK